MAKSREDVLATEFSPEFVRGMQDRMIVSYYKYGAVKNASAIDMVASLRTRLKKYEDTGNTEWLMDVANFAMIEHMYPRHPKAHFRGTDAHESPGRTDEEGYSTKDPNSDLGKSPQQKAREAFERRLGIA